MASQDGAGDGEEGDYGEDGGPGDEAGVDPLGYPVVRYDLRRLLWFTRWRLCGMLPTFASCW